MFWINQNTENSSTFIVKDVIASEQKNQFWIGDWFPAITHRTTLNTFYGNEWTNRPQLWLADLELSACKDTYCFENVSDKYNFRYSHVYIIKYPENGYIISSFADSDDYMLIFENSKVMIFRHIISQVFIGVYCHPHHHNRSLTLFIEREWFFKNFAFLSCRL